MPDDAAVTRTYVILMLRVNPRALTSSSEVAGWLDEAADASATVFDPDDCSQLSSIFRLSTHKD